MAAAIGLRQNFDGWALRRLAKKTRDANQIRRLLALAEIYDGGSRGDAALPVGVNLNFCHHGEEERTQALRIEILPEPAASRAASSRSVFWATASGP
jgi:hypothetical protein